MTTTGTHLEIASSSNALRNQIVSAVVALNAASIQITEVLVVLNALTNGGANTVNLEGATGPLPSLVTGEGATLYGYIHDNLNANLQAVAVQTAIKNLLPIS